MSPEETAAIQQALGLTRQDVAALARNAIEATFLGDGARSALLNELQDYLAGH